MCKCRQCICDELNNSLWKEGYYDMDKICTIADILNLFQNQSQRKISFVVVLENYAKIWQP